MQSPVAFFFAFVAVLALIGLAAWLVRRFGGSRLGTNANRGRMPRLAVIDAAAVDGRRRLVLVRRDNVEHLLMIGGPSDIVIEPNIVRATQSRDQLPQRPVGAETAPRVAPLEANWEPEAAEPFEPQLPEPPPPLMPPAPMPSAPAPMASAPMPPAPPPMPPVPPRMQRPSRPPFAEEPRRPMPPAPEPRVSDSIAAIHPEPIPRPEEPRRPEPMLRPDPVLRPEPPLRPELSVRVEPAPRPEPQVRPEPRLDNTPSRQARPEQMMPRPPREPAFKGLRASERQSQPPVAPAAAAAAAAAAPTLSSADQNLADMAQRLEAALRRPMESARPAETAAEPRVGAPSVAPEAPARTQPDNAPQPPAADPSIKAGFESLEDEMASLLGRTKTPS
ncbi:flagellar biosynthesis protein FliO [Rhodopseudomonas faecalis]|uniref:Flagellar biosynthesis protein FliO n=1 Tax=Rhodopseudomonas faecalis TaxID=99655 RepID=A0A318T973_9BRAD|nr:flagellar biosynthetic protein FliO [Rhodopseudomonas faecalis]PYF00167.1 flagellar biosynthesis protein FliO [Rhodopseudomonas faecalis]